MKQQQSLNETMLLVTCIHTNRYKLLKEMWFFLDVFKSVKVFQGQAHRMHQIQNTQNTWSILQS